MSEKENKDWSKFREQAQSADAKNLDDLLNELDLPNEDDVIAGEANHALNHPSYSDLEEQLTLAEQKAHEHWEKLERALAEVENIRRRADKEITNAHRYSLEKFSSSLLPVIDSLEHALTMTNSEVNKSVYEGLELTMKLFVDVLSKFEIKQLDPAGEVFDPQQHEAMSIQSKPDVSPNTVIAVFQKGYTLHGRVIRPARVVVSKE